MKRKVLVVGVAGLLVLGGAVGVKAFANGNNAVGKKVNTAELIPVEQAKEIAKKEVKDAYVESVELENEHGVLVYEVDLENNNVDVKVNAKTGEVVKVDHDDDKKVDQSNNNNQGTKNSKLISIEEAISIALKDTTGTIEDVELDDNKYYEIEIECNDGYEVELKIDTKTGKIIKKDVDDKDDGRNDD